MSASVSSGFQTWEAFETTRPQAEWFYCFRAYVWIWIFEITSPTKKISLNYHLNKFSQFNYHIWDMKYAWSSKKCVWCAWSYHLIAALWQFLNIQQLRSCYLAVCQFRANTLLHKAKQSADLDLLKLAKKRKSVWPALFRGNVCIKSDKISNVSAILGRKCTARLKVNQNMRTPPLSENLNNFWKRMAFSVLGSLRIVPLHSTLAVNKLGLKIVS